MPSIACLEQTRPEKWEYHFVLVQPDSFHDDEEVAAAEAEAALEEAFQERERSGSDLVMAEHLGLPDTSP